MSHLNLYEHVVSRIFQFSIRDFKKIVKSHVDLIKILTNV